jgi:nucleotide-binding universal stress UspA family protein
MTVDQELPSAGSVVVGVDGSRSSERALKWAHFIAQVTGGDLEVVVTWEPFTPFGWLGSGWETVPTDWNPAENAAQVAAATIDKVLGEQRAARLRLSVVEGNPAKALLKASAGARMLIVAKQPSPSRDRVCLSPSVTRSARRLEPATH